MTFSDANNDGVVTTTDIKQINHYYPFGLNMEGNWNGAKGDNKYGYNGKEWNDDFGLGLNDYGARWYDPMVDRWWNLDPESESGDQINWNPYHYVYDNPVKNIDPDGREGEGCCGAKDLVAGLVGVTVGVVDNLFGSNIREVVGDKMFGNGGLRGSFNEGLVVADKGSLVAGQTMVVGGTGLAVGGATVSLSGVGAVGGVPAIAVGAGTAGLGLLVSNNAAKNLQNSQVKANQNGESGERRKNRIPDKGEPNSTTTNPSGTTTKKYGPDGNVQKEFNKGHQGEKVPKNERKNHIHDYKPNPNNPSGRGDRQPGRPPKKNELKKDFGE